jgi:hypothetical protein
MTITGRTEVFNPAHATAEFTRPMTESITLRLDDARNPAFWAHIQITEAELRYALAQIQAHKEPPETPINEILTPNTAREERESRSFGLHDDTFDG